MHEQEKSQWSKLSLRSADLMLWVLLICYDFTPVLYKTKIYTSGILKLVIQVCESDFNKKLNFRTTFPEINEAVSLQVLS